MEVEDFLEDDFVYSKFLVETDIGKLYNQVYISYIDYTLTKHQHLLHYCLKYVLDWVQNVQLQYL